MSERILLSHGSGGKLSHDLVADVFVKAFSNPLLDRLDDSAVFPFSGGLAFTTDSYVVDPIFFPGGDIGRLAICGTANDLAMSGAHPLYLSTSFIIEEGFPLDDLRGIVSSMKQAADEAGVMVVTGDVKVVHKGSADKLFINTAGIGLIPDGVNISASRARPGDVVIVSGTIGDHGIAIMNEREGFGFSSELESDCAPLNHLVAEMLEVSSQIHCLRDPTRGGLATTLNEIAAQSGVGITIEEERIPIRQEVRAACELLGFDPLHIANEGKLVCILAAPDAEVVVERIQNSRYGARAAIIGAVSEKHPGRVVLRTSLGASRIIGMPVGELLPRIC